MADYPVFFRENKIKKFLRTIKSDAEKIDFLNCQLNTYYEIYSHESDKNIEEYYKKHKLVFLLYKGKSVNDKGIDSIIDLIDFDFSRFRHLSAKYKNLQCQIILLINYVEKEINDLKFTETIFEDNFKICFDKDELYKIMQKFGDDHYSALGWIEKEYDKISQIIEHQSPGLFYRIHSKYNLSKYMDYADPLLPGMKATPYLCYWDLEKYLRNVLLPAIESFKDEFEFKIALGNTYYENYDQLPDEEKFPLFKYNFYYANTYCESVFKSLEEQIEYFSYVILRFNMSHSPNSLTDDKNKSIIAPFNHKFEHLKTVYVLNRNKEKSTPLTVNIDTSGLIDGIKQAVEPLAKQTGMKSLNKIIPKSKQDAILIKHYFKISLEAEDVPKLKQLATEEFTVPFWSKKFLDIYFVTKLLKDIESKIDNDNINGTNHDLYIKLRDDVKSKITKATDAEKNKTGRKNKKSPTTNDNFKRDKDIFDGDDTF